MGLRRAKLTAEDDLLPEELVVASYMMKLIGLSIDRVTREDMWHLLGLYLMMNADMFPEHGQQEATAKIIKQHHLYFDVRQAENQTESFCAQTPVVCFRCFKEGHIARGCKAFKCFRCSEYGHVVAGCRKRRTLGGTPPSQKVSCPTSSPGGVSAASARSDLPCATSAYGESCQHGDVDCEQSQSDSPVTSHEADVLPVCDDIVTSDQLEESISDDFDNPTADDDLCDGISADAADSECHSDE